ncbi:peptide ABC transporter substrate-binding protein [Frigidibacter sp. MR17.14]|uniref:peptide ABC transporter substrate-binding protein n=1 Tax=Frigidibacter sp. MR17.14 TaxID=3126509 RepID=UPI003012E775
MTARIQSLSAVLLASTVLAGAIAGPLAAQGTAPNGDKLADDQTLTIRMLDEQSSLDPQLIEDVSGSDIARQLFEGLTNQDADGKLTPGVAESWDVSEDKLTYTFHLRDAKWSNGDPVTADDFVYAWQRAADPATASEYQWFIGLMSIKNADAVIKGEMKPSELGIRAVDPKTFEVTLSSPIPYFPQMTSHTTTYPAPKKVIEEFGEQWTAPEHIVSNGAYKLSEHVPNERTVAVKNENYWDAANVKIEKFVTLVINDESQALTRFQSGELDRTEMPAGQFPRMQKEHPEEAVSFPRLCNYYYTFNVSDSGPEAFKDVKVRQALSLAIDRDIITKNVLAGGQPPAYTFTPAATANFVMPDVEAAKMTQAERDAKAKELLTEAGYGPDNPLKFDMLYNTSEDHQKIAVAMSQMWKQKLGVQATLANQEWKTFLDTRSQQAFDMARGAWCGDYNEASTFLDLLTTSSGSNDGKYSNPEVDKLMLDARTAADPQADYTKVEEIIADEMPVIPVYHYAGVYMLDTDVGNWPVNNVEQNWYVKDMWKKAE